MKLYLRNVVVTSVITFLLVACGQDLTPQEELDVTAEYTDKAEYQSAKIQLLNAATRYPQNAAIRLELARLHLVLGDFAAAEKEADRASEAGASALEVQPVLVQALFYQRKYDDLIRQASELAEGLSDQDAALVIALLGQSFVSQGKTELAKNTVALSLEKDPGSEEAMLGLAAIALLEDDAQGAREWIQKALEINPESSIAWSALADLDAIAGRRVAAIESYSKSVALEHYVSLNVAKRAMMKIQIQDFTGARADLDTLRQSPLKRYWYLDYLEGLLHFFRGDYQSASESFGNVLNVLPGHVDSLLYAAIAQIRLGGVEQALSLANQLTRELPNSARAKLILGSALLSKQEFKRAEQVLEEVEVQDPENPEVQRLLGLIALYKGDTESALVQSKKLMSLAPDSLEAQEFYLLVNLIAGGDLGELARSVENLEDEYSREIWLAIADFRSGKHMQARERASKLREQYPDKVDPQQVIASTYLALGDRVRGEAELLNVLKIDEHNPSALMNLARLELMSNNPGKVDSYVQQFLTGHPRSSEAILFSQDMYARLGDLDKAVQVLEAGVRAVPEDWDLKIQLLRALYASKRIEDVIAFAQEIPDTEVSSSAEALEIIGLSYLNRSTMALALLAFEQWVQLEPSSATANLQYARALSMTGDLAGAKLAYEKAVSISPESLLSTVSLIRFHGENGDFKSAEAALAEAYKNLGEVPDLVALDGWLALLNQDYLQAEEKLSVAFKSAGNSETAILLARALAYQGKYEQSVATLDGWLVEHPNDLDVLLHKAGLYLANGKNSQALRVYKTIINSYPEHIPALNNVAWLSKDSDIDYALKVAGRAHSLAENDPYVLDTYGFIKVQAGDVETGLAMIRAASERAPNDWQVSLHLAEAYVEAGDKSQARIILDGIVSADAAPEAVSRAREIQREMEGE